MDIASCFCLHLLLVHVRRTVATFGKQQATAHAPITAMITIMIIISAISYLVQIQARACRLLRILILIENIQASQKSPQIDHNSNNN